MLQMNLALGAISATLFLIINLMAWRKRKRDNPQTSNTTFFTNCLGLLFSAIFYFGLPIWIWRYGFSRAILLIAACIAPGPLIGFALTAMGLPVDPIMLGILAQTPLRAMTGIWLAKNDSRWREEIIHERSTPKTPA